MSEVPALGDALPGAERALHRAVQRAPAQHSSWTADVVALLEAAGGPDVGNAVRAHLERRGGRAAALEEPPCDAGDLLDAAGRLHVAAHDDVRAALARACPPADDGGQVLRQERRDFAARELAARDAAVRAVLERLRAAGPGAGRETG